MVSEVVSSITICFHLEIRNYEMTISSIFHVLILFLLCLKIRKMIKLNRKKMCVNLKLPL